MPPSPYIVTTDWDGYARMQRLAARSRPPACREASEETPVDTQRLEADVRETLTALVDAGFADRYLAEPMPRPPIEVRVAPPAAAPAQTAEDIVRAFVARPKLLTNGGHGEGPTCAWCGPYPGQPCRPDCIDRRAREWAAANPKTPTTERRET